MRPSVGGIIAALLISGCASQPGGPSGPGGADALGPPPGLFVSPFGELFTSEPGQPWPTADWVAGADADADGRLTLAEFTADGRRVFAGLDLNTDGRIGPEETAAYEERLAAARARMPGFGGSPEGIRRPFPGGGPSLNAAPAQIPGGGGMIGRGQGAGGQRANRLRTRPRTGPLAYGPIAAAGFFNYPQPVKAADLDINQIITAEEWAQATERWFMALDTDQDGALSLATLPKTPLQEMFERRGL